MVNVLNQDASEPIKAIFCNDEKNCNRICRMLTKSLRVDCSEAKL